ncbi:MAG TPA: hypothetical protein PKJ36_02655, partial [Flavihumibacter sp.]|nr:hypothetical protein [Flavihumibacter sp.]
KYFLLCLAIASLTACQKDDAPTPDSNVKAALSVEFDNIVGGQNLVLNTGTYTNSFAESYSVSELRYYVSNFKLTNTSGVTYTVPQDSSYFLIVESDETKHEAELLVPQGDYSSISFTVGVDSLRSTMDLSKRTGVLDPAGDMETSMYWGWNSGYIFFKMEGISAAAPLDNSGQHKFRYHIGGFGGYSAPTINNIKTVTLDLTAGGVPKVRTGREANIHLMVDVAKVLDGNTPVSIAAHPSVMFSDFSVTIANNYSSMFRHDHTEN